ncbi:MAG: DUF2332 domain-containing protein [Rhodospirillaceae bacterium]|nr:DUF2332 domain-containing protein [Rhodospirillaceae bacterium]
MTGGDLDWDGIARSFAMQAKACAKDNASPTSAAILNGCAGALAGAHPFKQILAGWHDHRPMAAVPLRVLGALHRLALDGAAPGLAALMPSAGGTANPERAWAAAEPAIAAHAPFIAAYLTRAPQTNEVGRSAMLLGGFLEIAATARLPLRLLEIGASAGLNLCWDRYRVRSDVFSWGDPAAPLALATEWHGPAPPLNAAVAVAAREACDRDPLDVTNPDDVRRMESYVWCDQLDRLRRLRTAVAIARQTPFSLDRADAGDWLARKLADPAPGAATVVFHSVMWQYMDAATQARIAGLIGAAGARATPAAPIAWLAMEPSDLKSYPTVTLTMWPGGDRRTLGTVHFHGAWARWGAGGGAVWNA